MASTITTVEQRIQALPREMQDAILLALLHTEVPSEHVYQGSPKLALRPARPEEPDRSLTHIITDYNRPDYAYTSPLGMQINRSTRRMFARSYFSNRNFFATNVRDLRLWLKSLTPAHRDMIKTIMWDGMTRRGIDYAEPLDKASVEHVLLYLDTLNRVNLKRLITHEDRFICLLMTWAARGKVRYGWYGLNGKLYLEES